MIVKIFTDFESSCGGAQKLLQEKIVPRRHHLEKSNKFSVFVRLLLYILIIDHNDVPMLHPRREHAVCESDAIVDINAGCVYIFSIYLIF